MGQYLMRRISLAIVTFFVVVVMAFALLRIMPSGAAELMITDMGYADDIERLEEKLGLNKPLALQFWDWVSGLAQGNLGESLYSGEAITTELARRLPVTIRLGVMTALLGWAVGIPLGVLAAVKQGTVVDEVSRAGAVLFLALPNFWIAIMLLIFPSIWFGWAPPLRYTPFMDDPIANMKHLIWPALLGGLAGSAGLVRITRTMLLEVLRQDYIRTARAKGLGAGAVLFRHGLRNVAPPLLTIMGLSVIGILTGTVILEQIFGIPGVGRYVLEASARRDYPVVQGILLLTATLLIVSNLVVDLLYGYFDPRIRLAGRPDS
jgi:peptide/nickel transport system permease protein